MSKTSKIQQVQIKSRENPISGISEQVAFGNPRIIFRRIRGRIVPIINKRQIGQDLTNLGRTTTTIGISAIATAATLRIAKSKALKKLRPARKLSRVTKRFSRKLGVFDFSKAKNKLPKKGSFPKKIVTFAARNPLLSLVGLGAAAITAGVITSGTGFVIQAKTRFGARL